MSVDVRNGDCRDMLREMADGSVDVVVTDPPYGIEFPYIGYADTRDALVELIAGFLPEARRVARSRVVVLPGPTQIGLYPQPDWVGAVTWNTTASFGRYGYNQWTPVLCYGDDLPGFGSVGGMLKADVIAISGGAGVGFRRSDDERRHTCPKPLSIMRPLIRRYTAEGDLVLDPFAGSGSTGVAAALERRRFVGIEREPAYVEIARRRIADAQAQGDLFSEAA